MATNAPATAKAKPLAMMTKLSKFVSIYEPKDASSVAQTNPPAPKLVIIGSWMDAQDAHVAKYVTRYQATYPQARMAVVKYGWQFAIWDSEVVKAVAPLISYLRAQIDSGYLSMEPAKPEILLHLFSNGGMSTSREILKQFHEKTGHSFPLHVTVYDSCPGIYSWPKLYNAMILSVPKGLMRYLFMPLVQGLVLWFWISYIPWGRTYSLLHNTHVHNDKSLVKQTNRTYIYSKTDVMVEWKHVEGHAKEAEERGYEVRKELYVGTGHVAHMRGDEQRYWKIVDETWKHAVTGA